MTGQSYLEYLPGRLREVLKSLYPAKSELPDLNITLTRPEFEGHFTIVVFPLLKISGKGPEATAEEVGRQITASIPEVLSYNVIKGFLNFSLKDEYWLEFLRNEFSFLPGKAKGKIMVEYSSPNTNKPLHLGHIRNNLLGNSVSRILEAAGNEVIKAQVINDRGIHICKSMLAWQKFGGGETPASSGKKGDHLVGDYYVKFDQVNKAEVKALMDGGMKKEEAEKNTAMMREAQEMLRRWEGGDSETLQLWKTMNSWVYEGFAETYKSLGVDFDKLYYESETYLKGKEEVLKGLKEGVFIKKEDGSVWADLTKDGMEMKVLIRSDGTSVYMTQDIGTAIMRFDDFPGLEGIIYTVGDEQNYHFKVLFAILRSLSYPWAGGCRHLSYGMVELPSGKMKSREGTVVDADDLLAEMFEKAAQKTAELGKLNAIPASEHQMLFRRIGLAALKYFILRVDPKKQIVFNPEESIDFAGNTGPFIQYTHARIRTMLSKSGIASAGFSSNFSLLPSERDVIRQIALYPAVLSEAAAGMNPAVIANFTYELVRLYNHFYQTVPILREENEDVKKMRLRLSSVTADHIRESMLLLGIEVPDRM